MRYQGTAKGPSAEVTCTLDNIDCKEFKSTSYTNVRECFISGETKQMIKVVLQLRGIYGGDCQADLIIDGILRDTIIWRKKSFEVRSHTFECGIWKAGRTTYRSPLKLAELAPELSALFDPASIQTTVGTIEIRIFKADPNGTHKNMVPDYSEQNKWEDSDLMAGTAGIEPTHKIVPSALEGLGESRRKTTRASFVRERPGLTPWAIFRFLYRGLKSLNDAGVLTTLPVSPDPTDAESSDEDELESVEEDPVNDETEPAGDHPAISTAHINDTTAFGPRASAKEAAQNPYASQLAEALDKEDRDIIASVVASVAEATSPGNLAAPVAHMTLPTAEKSPNQNESSDAERTGPMMLVDSDQPSEGSARHFIKASKNSTGSEHIQDRLYSDENDSSTGNQAVSGLGLDLGGERRHMDANVTSNTDTLDAPLSERIGAEGGTAFRVPPKSPASLARDTTNVTSNANILPVNIKSSPGLEANRPWSFPPNELRHPQPSTAGESSPSPEASQLANDDEADNPPYSPLYVSPEPPEDPRPGNLPEPYLRPTSLISVTSNTNSNNQAPMPETPNALKRSFGTLMLNGQEQQEVPLLFGSTRATKRRKIDIKALRVELEGLAKRKVDSARRVIEARRKREAHERTLNEQYEALERERLEMLKSIAADNEAEEEYLRGIEDDSE
ncbi:hypothetical protein MMC11_000327 [Xylographa trunciseda]|nr:hypothetical protein [Xylographa trunciseda]